ncbi:hypothetical protein M8C21_008119, partial [Ambrosia artemisiifolia]
NKSYTVNHPPLHLPPPPSTFCTTVTSPNNLQPPSSSTEAFQGEIKEDLGRAVRFIRWSCTSVHAAISFCAEGRLSTLVVQNTYRSERGGVFIAVDDEGGGGGRRCKGFTSLSKLPCIPSFTDNNILTTKVLDLKGHAGEDNQWIWEKAAKIGGRGRILMIDLNFPATQPPWPSLLRNRKSYGIK